MKNLNILNNQKGAVLPLFAIALVVIMGIIGLTIDTSLTNTAHRQHEDIADMIALSVIEQYSQLPTDDILLDRVNLAAQRGSEIATENFNFWVGQNFLQGGKTDQGDVGSSAGAAGLNGEIVPGFWYFNKPVIDPVTGGGCETKPTWLDQSPEYSSCPCDPAVTGGGADDDGWRGSCFVPVDNFNDPDASVNAFRVNLFTDDQNDMLHTFSQINNAAQGSASKGFKIGSSATTAFVPRHVLLAVDLSPSIASETHGAVKDSATGLNIPEKFGEFAYQASVINQNELVADDPLDDRFELLPLSDIPSPSDIYFYTLDYTNPPILPNPFHEGLFGAHAKSWACLLSDTDNSGSYNGTENRLDTPSGAVNLSNYCPAFVGDAPDIDPTLISSRQNYREFPILSEDGKLIETGQVDPVGWDGGAFVEPKFLIDTMNRPEPLYTVMDAVHTVMDRFSSIGLPSDRVGVVGFDDDILAPRVTKNLSGEAALLTPSDQPGNDYYDMMEALNPDNPLNAPGINQDKAFWDRMFFPRQYSGATYRTLNERTSSNNGITFPVSDKIVPYSQSALYHVMSRSLGMFAAAPESRDAQRMFIMFTDGMATCVDPVDPGDESDRAYSSHYPHYPPYNYTTNASQTTVCSDVHFAHNIKGIEDIIQLSKENFAEQGISFNVFMFGNAGAPHTLLRKSEGDDGGCMSDIEARRLAAQSDINNFSQFNLVDSGFGDPRNVISDTDFESNHFNRVRDHYAFRSAANPWYAPNHIYFATRFSGGAWVPIRPPCRLGGAIADVNDELNDLCSAMPNNVFNGSTSTSPLGELLDIDGNRLADSALDDRGRLRCDPFGHNTSDQVERELSKLLDTNPFVLVSERTATGF